MRAELSLRPTILMSSPFTEKERLDFTMNVKRHSPAFHLFPIFMYEDFFLLGGAEEGGPGEGGPGDGPGEGGPREGAPEAPKAPQAASAPPRSPRGSQKPPKPQRPQKLGPHMPHEPGSLMLFQLAG